MATYKKQGQKKVKSAPVEEVISDENSTTAEVFNTLDETASKSEQWVEKNSKPLFLGLIAIAVVILGYLAYNTYVVGPNEEKAADELAYPKADFEKASNNREGDVSYYKLALEGTNGKYGFVDIADKFSGTSAGNLANYYAGISYLKIKDYKNAIAFLGKFSSDDAILGPTALGAIGDAFADLNQLNEALSYYEKAANSQENNASTPFYLYKMGNTYLDLGNPAKAAELFTQIKEKYPTVAESFDIDMAINKAKYAN